MEDITKLLPTTAHPQGSLPRYQSRYHDAVVRDRDEGRRSRALFGPAMTPLRPPFHFLLKGESHNVREGLRRVRSAQAEGLGERRCEKRPTLPRPTSAYPPPYSPLVDHINTNRQVVEALQPPGPSQMRAINCRGDLQNIAEAGLYPKYSLKQRYGQVPPYIQKKLRELREERRRLEEKKRRQEDEKEKQKVYLLKGGGTKKGKVLHRNHYQFIGGAQRTTLVQSLLRNLQEKQARLQRLPVVCETRATIAQRDCLERDIANINQHLFLLQHYDVAVTDVG